MKRMEVYWNHYRDSMNNERKVPVLIVSNDAYNANGVFVSAVRVVQSDNRPCKHHVFIPGQAFAPNPIMGDSVALCETVGSFRQATMTGPVTMLTDPETIRKVEEGIKIQLGMHELARTTLGQNEFHTYAYAGRARET